MNKSFEWKVGRSERFLANLELRFTLGEAHCHGTLKDLSIGGARIVSETPVSLHDQLKVSLILPSQTVPLEIPQATVRWILGREFGVEFFGETVDCTSFRRLVVYLSWLKDGSPLHPETDLQAERKAA